MPHSAQTVEKVVDIQIEILNNTTTRNEVCTMYIRQTHIKDHKHGKKETRGKTLKDKT